MPPVIRSFIFCVMWSQAYYTEARVKVRLEIHDSFRKNPPSGARFWKSAKMSMAVRQWYTVNRLSINYNITAVHNATECRKLKFNVKNSAGSPGDAPCNKNTSQLQRYKFSAAVRHSCWIHRYLCNAVPGRIWRFMSAIGTPWSHVPIICKTPSASLQTASVSSSIRIRSPLR